ncbi:MAG: DUF3579 domain-containing protein [Burkholderiaceae bacterium]
MIERPVARSFLIVGLTTAGKVFRPSDWAERIGGVMASYRPGARVQAAHLGYSPYVMPSLRGDLRCVRVDGRLNQIEPMAYQFMVAFARDNDLTVEDLGAVSPAPDGATPATPATPATTITR